MTDRGSGFVDLVEHHLVGPMDALGYDRIREDGPHTLGFEAKSSEVMSRVRPQDPLSADEAWIRFDPDSGAIEFGIGCRLDELLAYVDSTDRRSLASDPHAPIEVRIPIIGEAVSALSRSVRGR